MKRTILSLMLLVASLTSFAYGFEVDGIYYNVFSKDDLTCEVTSGDNRYTGEVAIPKQDVGDMIVAHEFSVMSPNNVISGTCGENIKWNFDEQTGVLTIYGSGPMSDYSNSKYIPWYGKKIKHIEISEGVTSIGSMAFIENFLDGNNYLLSVSIPKSLTSIGFAAFER